ncbi:MAG: glycosyltransferase [Syntrophomonadaceae bacterium]|nr:glycosyltransferase [Syntrophomonadaceae bacterium]
MQKLENQDIVCIAGVDFEPLWTRTQQLVWRLPESNRILYVETPVNFLSPFKDPALWDKWRLWRRGTRKIKNNLYLYSPPPLLPFANRCRLLNRINQRIMGRILRGICRKLDFRQPVLLTYLPNTADMAGCLGEKLLVYDCVDEHSAFQGFDPRVVSGMEIDLLQKSDLVFVTAQPLYEDKSRYAENIHMLRNAADVKHFQKAQGEDTPVPADVANLPAPVLGFIGRIKEWVDLDLLKQVAEARPEWSIVMIGPVELDADTSSFKGVENVHFIGSRPKEVLPNYLKKFDVCLNPFRASRLTRAVNPLKFYEYLASGKPVVSTPMPEMEEFAGTVEIGEGRDGFIEAVERALDDSPEKVKARLQLSWEHSWEKRVEAMSSKIAEHLKGKEESGLPLRARN